MASTELRALPQCALRRDHTIFAAALALQTAHLLDEALNPHNGAVDVSSKIVALAMGVAAVAFYGRFAVWARILLAGLFGLAGVVGGLNVHVLNAIEHGASGSDYSGFGHAAAGLVLLALAVTLALQRNPQPSSRGLTDPWLRVTPGDRRRARRSPSAATPARRPRRGASAGAPSRRPRAASPSRTAAR